MIKWIEFIVFIENFKIVFFLFYFLDFFNLFCLEKIKLLVIIFNYFKLFHFGICLCNISFEYIIGLISNLKFDFRAFLICLNWNRVINFQIVRRFFFKFILIKNFKFIFIFFGELKVILKNHIIIFLHLYHLLFLYFLNINLHFIRMLSE